MSGGGHEVHGHEIRDALDSSVQKQKMPVQGELFDAVPSKGI